MLLIVGWSSVVVWLNVRPRYYELILHRHGKHYPVLYAEYGCPWGYSWQDVEYYDYTALAANIAIGLLAVLTFASKYLLRAIVAALRALLSKPPPSNENGPERAR